MTDRFPTTIVVPLYGDLPSAEKCIASVLEHVDLTFHRLLVVNDVGPDADLMEARVKELLAGREGTRYERNPHNLGFVGTCNRAATELDTSDNDILLLNSDAAVFPGTVDEMSRVLHFSEKHGVATARSNYATIATIPNRTATGEHTTPERSREVFEALNQDLPRFNIVPVAHGFCFLVRRSLIRNYGFFDTAFAPGYGEENEFCLRVNARGFSSVMANRAYASHEGEKSFSSLKQEEIKAAHERLLIERYPFYPSALFHYDDSGIDTVDWFADFLVPADRDQTVLIDLHHMSLIYDGSVRNALTFLEFLAASRESGALDGLKVTIVSSSEAIEFFDLGRFGFTVRSNEQLTELFDVGFALTPVTTGGQIQRLDRHCVRWVASHLDIIALRIIALWDSEYPRAQVVVDSLRFADRVVAISEATVRDTIERFPQLATELPARTTVIHQGVASSSFAEPADSLAHHTSLTDEQAAVISAGGYVLTVGNTFLHKQVAEAVAALGGAPFTVVAFGGSPEDLPANVIPVRGGYLTDGDVAQLYDNAGVIVYPSVYEGFGLPIAEAALHGKPLVLFDTQVAREVASVLDLDASAHFFSDFADLAPLVMRVLATPLPDDSPRVRTMEEYNQGILDVIREVLAEQPSIEHLRRRRAHFLAARAYETGALQRVEILERELSRRSIKIAQVAMKKLRPLRRAVGAARRATRKRRPRL